MKIDSLLARFAAITWISVFLGTILPALVAAQHQVFYKGDIEKQIIAHQVKPAADIQTQKELLKARIQVVNSALTRALTTPNNSTDVKSLVNLRNDVQEELAKLDEQIVVAPFYLNDLMVAWSAMYITLGSLIFIILPKTDGRASMMSWKIALAVGAMYPLYQGPVWLRNFVLSNEQRRVYSFANYDICPSSFWMQELNTFLWLILLTLLWHRWFVIYKHRSNVSVRESPPAPSTAAREGKICLLISGCPVMR